MAKKGRPLKNDLESYGEETEEELEADPTEETQEEDETQDEEDRLLEKLNKIRKKKQEERLKQELPTVVKLLHGKINKIVDNQLKMYDILQEHHEQIQNLLNKSMTIQK